MCVIVSKAVRYGQERIFSELGRFESVGSGTRGVIGDLDCAVSYPIERPTPGATPA